MNQSEKTREQQVLEALRRAGGEWIDGPDLANERVGGSEGLRRLRDLIAAGHPIEKRRHPDPARDIWQYRLTRSEFSSAVRRDYTYVPAKPELLASPPEEPTPTTGAFDDLPRHLVLGEVAVCPRCRAKTHRYNYKDYEGARHKDPHKKGKPCLGCNGWGIVPNQGPIAMAPPEGLK